VSIVSTKLAGKTLLQRHRAINDALKQEMAHIHALSIKRAEAPPPAEG
jgi:stress-induced morphogen